MSFTTSLIISTYNSPQYLQLSLESVMHQSVMPDQIVIADDGSKAQTREVIDSFRTRCQVPILHVWHEDNGFHKTVILNKAIALATGHYIIQIDGDIVVSPKFIYDHIRIAKQGCFSCGSRVIIRKKATDLMLNSRSIHIPYTTRLTTFNAYRIGPLFRFMIWLNSHRDTFSNGRGCNMAMWRNDFIAINGYDESFAEWGYEDSDLVARLVNNGVKKQNLKLGAVQYHLEHPHNSRIQADHNQEMLRKAIENRQTKCIKGINQYI